MKKISFIVLMVSLLISCQKSEDPVDSKVQNDNDIKSYLEKNNLEAQRSETGLYYIVETQGTGKSPNATSNVTVAYKGYFLDGKTFDQSGENGISFGLNQVIKGWTEGIPYFNEGGKGQLLIPSHLGYGNHGRPGIPGGSVLIFDIHLISVN